MKLTESIKGISFQEALNNSRCPCGNRLQWEAAFDADGTTYYASCEECHLNFHMSAPVTVDIEVTSDAE